MRLRSRPVRVLLVLASLALVLGACGDDDDGGDGTATTDTPTTESDTAADDSTTTSPTDATDPEQAAGTGAGVEVVQSDLGEILASDGMTLYLFTTDEGGESACYDECASNWPPLLAEGEVAVGEGLDEALFDTVARDDGGEQVTVDGHPLYFFAGDQAPGDVNGQGVGDAWYVVSPDGAAIEEGGSGY